MIRKGNRFYDISVLGGGPAGLTAALVAAKTARTLLILKHPPYRPQQFRIDVVPARTLALLVELGIDPQAIGAERLNTCRGDCWATSSPQWRQCASTAHIERMRLEKALSDNVRANTRIEIIIGDEPPKFDGEFTGRGWRSRALIDATGRRSITSQARTRLLPVWGSRFFWTSRHNAKEASPEFRIAALPCGYAYRLGSAERIGIGLVGRSELMSLSWADLLRHESFQWLCENLPALGSLIRGASGAASVQWSSPGQASLVGDAAIARDSLSSQGLAASLSDALYAVTAIAFAQQDALCLRHAENLFNHLTHLHEQISQCRYSKQPLWKEYADFISLNIARLTRKFAPALRSGRLEPIALVAP